METPKEYHYTYYSYEEWGRGYIGSRTCRHLPEEDVKYFGSFGDKTFKPTQKIILKYDYATREEAIADEVRLHNYFEVNKNSHFANRAKQTCTGFSYVPTREQAIKNGKKSGNNRKKSGTGICGLTREQRVINAKKADKTNKKNRTGIYSITPEQRREYSKKSGKIGGQKNKELGLGICGLSIEERRKNAIKSVETNMKNKTAIFAQTPEQLSKNAKKAAEVNRKNGTAIFGMSKEQRSENGKKSSAKNKENKVGIFALTTEQLIENAKKGGAISSKIINAQRWECCETGYISTPAGVVSYQRARGIDTSKNNRRRIA
jgi:hypothetical protein